MSQKNLVTDEEVTKLIASAKAIVKNSYSPYSHFAVGAAVLTYEGKIFTGVNIENASYGLTICAERIAIGATISAGNTNIKAIAIYSPDGMPSPCGACRQFITEFGNDINVIIVPPNENVIIQKTISELLPINFDKTTLL